MTSTYEWDEDFQNLWHQYYQYTPKRLAKLLNVPLAELKSRLLDSGTIKQRELDERETLLSYCFDDDKVTDQPSCVRCGILVYNKVPKKKSIQIHQNKNGYCPACHEKVSIELSSNWEDSMLNNGWVRGLFEGQWVNHVDGRHFWETDPIRNPNIASTAKTIGEYLRFHNIVP